LIFVRGSSDEIINPEELGRALAQFNMNLSSDQISFFVMFLATWLPKC
jgi:hypothetical protein